MWLLGCQELKHTGSFLPRIVLQLMPDNSDKAEAETDLKLSM